jgi:hypothetical protein
LFDLHLICIDTETMTVMLSPQLQNTSYQYLADEPLQFAREQGFPPGQSFA